MVHSVDRVANCRQGFFISLCSWKDLYILRQCNTTLSTTGPSSLPLSHQGTLCAKETWAQKILKSRTILFLPGKTQSKALIRSTPNTFGLESVDTGAYESSQHRWDLLFLLLEWQSHGHITHRPSQKPLNKELTDHKLHRFLPSISWRRASAISSMDLLTPGNNQTITIHQAMATDE